MKITPRLHRSLALAGFAIASFVLASPFAFGTNVSYDWQGIGIGGGGYVTGIVPHPQDYTVVYGRTDAGGAFIWRDAQGIWVPLLDMMYDNASYSVESMCVDPSDTLKETVMAATGRGPLAPNISHVYYSTNQGTTWTDTGFPTAAWLDGNGNYRWAGERMAIDPKNSKVVYLGTRDHGLYHCYPITTANSWTQVNTTGAGSVPVGTALGQNNRNGSYVIGVTFVAFDSNSGTTTSGFHNNITVTKGIFVGVAGQGVYHSTDGGATFNAINSSGYPVNPIQGRFDPVANALYVTQVVLADGGSDGVAKYVKSSGAWSNITPSGTSSVEYSGVDVDPSGNVVVTERAQSSVIFRSTDGGSQWSNLTANSTQEPDVGWWPTSYFAAQNSCVRCTPVGGRPNQVWFGDWYGFWKSGDTTVSPVVWGSEEYGHEEVVSKAIQAVGPSDQSGVLLYTGCVDVSGFRHTTLTPNLSVSPTQLPGPTVGAHNITSIAPYEHNNATTNYVYFVGDFDGNDGAGDQGGGMMSTSGGAPNTWTTMTNPTKTACGGRVCVSAANPTLVVWLPFSALAGSDNMKTTAYWSTDGLNFTESTGLPASDWYFNVWGDTQPLAADLLTTNQFYAYKPDLGFYKSNTGVNAGQSFSSVSNSLPTNITLSGSSRFGICTVPGQDGGIWAYIDWDGDDWTPGTDSRDGIYTSTDHGTTFHQLSNVQTARMLSFGATTTGENEPATVYMYGTLTGGTQQYFLYRSIDFGASWQCMNGAAGDDRFGAGVSSIAADRKTYGVLYMGTSGRGFYAGTDSSQ